MIFYRHLFNNEWGLSPNEGLVYSALLSHSLMVSDHFNVEGSFDVGYAKAFIRENIDTKGAECIDYRPVSTRRLAKVLSMSENTVRRIKEDLRYKYHLITGNVIICPIELLDSGYIDIPPDTGLKGLQLAFYGLLRDRSRLYHGVIDTWAEKLADLMGIDKKDVYNLLMVLHKKGFVERRNDGKLRVV